MTICTVVNTSVLSMSSFQACHTSVSNHPNARQAMRAKVTRARRYIWFNDETLSRLVTLHQGRVGNVMHSRSCFFQQVYRSNLRYWRRLYFRLIIPQSEVDDISVMRCTASLAFRRNSALLFTCLGHSNYFYSASIPSHLMDLEWRSPLMHGGVAHVCFVSDTNV